MAKYYPKSQIIPNLYASDGANNRVDGTLLLSTTKENYTGFFWATSDNKYFTGKTPTDKPTIELIKDTSDGSSSTFDPLNPISKTKSTLALFLNDPEIEIRGLAGPTPSGNPNWGWSQLNVVRYATSKGISLNDPPEYDNPYTNPTLPSDTDYKLGSFYRYFAQKRNANVYIEIDKNMYDDIIGKSNSVTYFEYKAFRILWTLTGKKDQVKQVNINSVDLVVRTLNLQGLDKFLNSNYLEYYGLYTEGGEYKLPNGQIYTGLYHVHPDKGPMVGRSHVETPHEKLTPIDQPILFTTSSLTTQPTQPQRQTTTPSGGSVSSGGGYSSGY